MHRIRVKVLALLVLLTGLGLWGCQSPKSPAITLWTAFEGPELVCLKSLCQRYSQEHQQPVLVLKVPFVELQRKFLIAAPAGQGPDLILGPQDWLGVFATAQLLQPIDCPDQADYSKVALQGVNYQNQIYARPLVLDCLFLLRNPRLAPRSPKSLQELREYALELTHQGSSKGFYVDIQDFYFSWPFFAGHGCQIFQPDSLTVGFTGPEGVAALDYLKSLREADLIPSGATNDIAKSLFLEQKVAMTLNGPWFLGDVRAKGVPYVIEPIPPAKTDCSPLVGVNGLMLNKQAAHPNESTGLINFLSSPAVLAEMSLASGRPPARQSALALVAKDKEHGQDIVAIGKVADKGVALPNHPAATAIWEPMKQAIELVSKGQTQAQQELQRVQSRIDSKIKLMME